MTEKKTLHPTVPDLPEKAPGLKWHKFLIYFALYAAAVWNVFMGILQVTGLRYVLNSYIGHAIMIPEEMYFYYPPLKITDAIFYVTLFAMAVYQIYIRFMLAKGKKRAVMHLNIMICIMCTVSALYDFLFSAFVRNERYVLATINYSSAAITAFTAVVIGVGLCIFNSCYYKKRIHLFEKRK